MLLQDSPRPCFLVGGVGMDLYEKRLVQVTLRQTNIAMENGPLEDVFPIKNGDFPLLC